MRNYVRLGLMAAALWSSEAWGACAAPMSLAEFTGALDDALREYPKFEDGSFMSRAEALAAEVPCITEKIDPERAAAIHRMMGFLTRLTDGNDKRARVAFAASRSAAPSYDLPQWIAGPLDPERAEFNAIPTELVSSVDVRQPVSGTITFDGKSSALRPNNFPTLFQRLADDGRVIETHYLWPGDQMPEYPAVPIYEERPPGGGELVVSGLAAAAAGAGITMIALSAWDTQNICPEDHADQCKLQARERLIAGSTMIVVGTSGFLLGQFFLDGGRPGVGVGVRTRW